MQLSIPARRQLLIVHPSVNKGMQQIMDNSVGLGVFYKLSCLLNIVEDVVKDWAHCARVMPERHVFDHAVIVRFHW